MRRLFCQATVCSSVPGSRASATAVLLTALTALPAAAQSLAWSTPFGTSKHEHPTDAAPDGAGGVYLCGHDASGPGWPGDAWLTRYDSAGTRMWIGYLGLPADNDAALAVAPDGAGGAYVSGYFQWFSTQPAPAPAWLARFDGAGNALWVQQISTGAAERSDGCAPDGVGGAYFSGITSGDLGGPNAGGFDAWLARYDGAGSALWIRQLGSAGDESQVVAAADGAGGVYLFGNTTGVMGATSQGKSDVWVAHYDSTGNQVWLQQHGSAADDFVEDAATDAEGRLFACGRTYGAFGGSYVGWQDAWLGRFDGQGSPTWIRQLGVRAVASALTLTADGLGGVYVSGAEEAPDPFALNWKMSPWLAHYSGEGLSTWMERFEQVGSIAPSAAAPDEAGGCFVGSGGILSTGSALYLGDSTVARYWGACEAASYCTASSTSIPGCQPAIGSLGSPSVADPSGFTITSGNVPGGSNLGLCLFGDQGAASLPMGTLGGVLCVAAPSYRTAPAAGGGNAGVCDGNYAFSLQDLIDAAPIVAPGKLIHAQVWARDPANPDAFLLSDALRVTVCP